MTQDQGQTLKKGDQIGVYEIRGVIHVGRSGIIYRIWNEHINAVEVLAEYFPCDFAMRLADGHTVGPKSENERAAFEQGKTQFLQQAESLSDIEQTNIIRVHNELEFNDTAYMVMDNAGGTPLSKLTGSSASFTQTELEYILISLLEGLHKVHEQGTFHGDIHPSNIVIRKNGEPVLINFGATRLTIASHHDNPGEFLRAGYAPDELYDKGYSPGAVSDLYSLGATIYRCITKTDPIAAAERLSAIDHNGQDPYKSGLTLAGSGFSETFLEIIFRMLDPDANKRYQSAAEVLGDLKRNVAGGDSTNEIHKLADNSQQAVSVDSGKHRVLWIGAVMTVAFIIFGLWSFQDEKKQVEIYLPETDMKTVSVLQKQEVQPAESAQEKSEIAIDSGVTAEVKSTESPDQQATDENLSSQISDGQMDVLAPVEKTSISSVDQEKLIESTDISPKTQEYRAEIKQSLPLETQVVSAADKEAIIEQHLAAAEEALMNFRLTTPPGDNAYQNYQNVLGIDPENVEAIKGLHLIVEKYVRLIERSIEQDNIYNARVYLNRAESILPDSPEVQRLSGVLKLEN